MNAVREIGIEILAFLARHKCITASFYWSAVDANERAWRRYFHRKAKRALHNTGKLYIEKEVDKAYDHLKNEGVI